MTDSALDKGRDPEELPTLVESERLGGDGTAADTPFKLRVLLPLVVPLLSIAIVAVLVLDISRVFLAGDKDAALVMSIVITLAILIGASLVAAAPRLRTSSLAMILGGVLVVVSLAGLLSLGPSLDTGDAEAAGYVEPTGKAVGTVDVEALAVDQVQRDGLHRAGRHRGVQLHRRHRSHARHPGPAVRRLRAHDRRRWSEDGQGRAGGRRVHALLHGHRVTPGRA